MSPLTRAVRLDGPYSLAQTVGVLRHGGSDPTCRVVGGVWWFGQATPEGPCSLSLHHDPSAGEVTGAAWGPGARWALDRLPALLGALDDRSGFVAHDELVAAGLRANPGWRIPASGLVVQSLVAAVIEQRVTGNEAFASQARLVRRFGAPAPGDGAAVSLYVPPAPREWGQIPSWEWLGAGVDRARSAVAVRVSSYAGRLEECASLPLGEAHRRLRAIPGVGEWTAAEVAQRALGDPDSPSFGDYHMAKNLTWALTGEIGDDDLARQLLEPYAGQRYRASGYIAMAAGMRPRRGPRMTLPTHLPRVPRSP